MPIQQKLTPSELLYSVFAGWVSVLFGLRYNLHGRVYHPANRAILDFWLESLLKEIALASPEKDKKMEIEKHLTFNCR